MSVEPGFCHCECPACEYGGQHHGGPDEPSCGIPFEGCSSRCEASTTTNLDDECRTYQCLLPKGHEDAHAGGATIEWTDETTVPRPEPSTPDGRFMAAVASYVDDWRAGDGAWHGAGHIHALCDEHQARPGCGCRACAVAKAVREERDRCAHAVAENKSAKETLDMILRPESYAPDRGTQ